MKQNKTFNLISVQDIIKQTNQYNNKIKLKEIIKIDEDRFSIQLSDFEDKLSIRIRNIFSNYSIVKIGDVLNLSIDDLKNMRNLGNKCINEIFNFLYTLTQSVSENNTIDSGLFLDNIFQDMGTKRKEIIISRYYSKNTLEEIGSKYNITRERARQIIASIENKYFQKTENNELLDTVKRMISRKNIIEKQEIYSYVSQYGESKIAITFSEYLLNKIHCYKYSEYVVSEDIKLDQIYAFLESLTVMHIKDLFKLLKQEYNFLSDLNIEFLFKISNKYIIKNGYFINPTIPNKILYIFYIEKRPIHISELEELYFREFGQNNKMHNLHAHIQRIENIILCERGKYTLKNTINNTILKDKRVIRKIINLLNKRKIDLNVDVIHKEIKSKYSLTEIKLLLDTNKNFANFGRGYYGLKNWDRKKRHEISDIIYNCINKIGKPVEIDYLLEHLKTYGRYMGSWSLGANLSKSPVLKRISVREWALKSWKEYPEYISRERCKIKEVKAYIINFIIKNDNQPISGMHLYRNASKYYSFSNAALYHVLRDATTFQSTSSGYKLREEYFNLHKEDKKIFLKDIPKIRFIDFYECLQYIYCKDLNVNISNYIKKNQLKDICVDDFINTYKIFGYLNNRSLPTEMAVNIYNRFYEKYCQSNLINIKIDYSVRKYEKELLRFLYYDILDTNFGQTFIKLENNIDEIEMLYIQYFDNEKQQDQKRKEYILSWSNAVEEIKNIVILEQDKFVEEKERKMNKNEAFLGYYDYLRDIISEVKEENLYGNLIQYYPDVFKLLTILLESKTLDINDRILINCAVAYMVVPNDILPESKMESTGLIDDLFIGLYVIDKLLNGSNRNIILNFKKDYEFINNFEILYDNTRKIVRDYIDQILTFAGISE